MKISVASLLLAVGCWLVAAAFVPKPDGSEHVVLALVANNEVQRTAGLL